MNGVLDLGGVRIQLIILSSQRSRSHFKCVGILTSLPANSVGRGPSDPRSKPRKEIVDFNSIKNSFAHKFKVKLVILMT